MFMICLLRKSCSENEKILLKKRQNSGDSVAVYKIVLGGKRSKVTEEKYQAKTCLLIIVYGVRRRTSFHKPSLFDHL